MNDPGLGFDPLAADEEAQGAVQNEEHVVRWMAVSAWSSCGSLRSSPGASTSRSRSAETGRRSWLPLGSKRAGVAVRSGRDVDELAWLPNRDLVPHPLWNDHSV